MSQSSGGQVSAPRGLAERALEVSLAGLLVILPFSHTAAAIRALLAMALAAALVLAWRDRAILARALPPYAVPLLAWMAWCLASLAWSVDPALTVSDLRGELLYTAAVVFVVHVATARAGLERGPLASAAVGASALLAMTTLAWTSTGLNAYFSPGVGNASSTVLVLFPVAFAAVMASEAASGTRRAGIAMAAALLVAGLTTFNRTLGPALAIELVLVVVLLDGRKLAKRLIAVLAVALVFAAIQAGVAQVVRFSGEGAAAHAERDDPRWALWSHVAGRIGEAPVLGHGYGREILAADLRKTVGNPFVSHAHNVFLDAGLQLGFPGIVLLLVLFASIAAAGLRQARSRDPLARACGVALVALVAGTVTRNLSDDLWVRQNALLFWLVVGVLSGVAERRLRPPPTAR